MKVACVLGPKFEDSEFQEPYDALRKAGHAVTIVGLESGAEPEGDKGKVTAKGDKSIQALRPQAVAALRIPGGARRYKSPCYRRAWRWSRAEVRAGRAV